MIESFKLNPNHRLFPEVKPSQTKYLRVSNIHELYIETYGNPKGIPVVLIHGGPGGGGLARNVRYFDPATYHIILYDQRGAKRSKPTHELKENNTQAQIQDLEQIRAHFNIDQWLVYGGSWGSTLALLYGEAHPASCLGFILRGIYLCSDEEINNLLYDAQKIYPDYWEEMINTIPSEEHDDLLNAIYKRVIHPDPAVHLPVARAFIKYDIAASTLAPDFKLMDQVLKDDILTVGVTRMYFHYTKNGYFIEKNQILRDLHKISHLPAYIIHGRHDAICKVQIAYRLHKAWPNSKLYIAERSGHASLEPEIEKATRTISEIFKEKLKEQGTTKKVA